MGDAGSREPYQRSTRHRLHRLAITAMNEIDARADALRRLP